MAIALTPSMTSSRQDAKRTIQAARVAAISVTGLTLKLLKDREYFLACLTPLSRVDRFAHRTINLFLPLLEGYWLLVQKLLQVVIA